MLINDYDDFQIDFNVYNNDCLGEWKNFLIQRLKTLLKPKSRRMTK